MGFWHTGYLEFHEPVGIDMPYDPSPAIFPCQHCEESFSSPEKLQDHRFEAHPLRRPVMMLKGRELGVQRVRITQRLLPTDVWVEGCDRATLNGKKISVSSLPLRLARTSSDVCRVVLSKSGVDAEFNLDFRIAEKNDLAGIEKQFLRTANGRRLDTRAVDEFISATSAFGSAIGYCDGICAYLYGVLAKERASDCSLSYEEYVRKFNKASDELAAYDRPLSRTIRSLIEFHFNHFRESARLSPDSRVGYVADRYATWIGPPRKPSRQMRQIAAANGAVSSLETLVTDWETEQIVRWVMRPLGDLAKDAADIESLIAREIAEYDKVKLHILLGEFHTLYGNTSRALRHAKAVRNFRGVETWAEALISAPWGNDDGDI